MLSSTKLATLPPECPASQGKVIPFPSSARVAPSDAVPEGFPERVLERYDPPAELARKRGAWWGTVAACCHAPPPPRLLDAVADGTLTAELEALFGPEVAEAFGDGADTDRVEVCRDHDGLFKVPGGQYLTPNESVWVDTTDLEGNRRKPLLMGPSTVDAQRRYKRFHLELDSSTGELVDFIGFELMFMERLCELEAVAWDKRDYAAVRFLLDQQRAWIEDHLIRWVDDLCERMAEKARSSFYGGLALLIPAIVRQEREILSELLEE